MKQKLKWLQTLKNWKTAHGIVRFSLFISSNVTSWIRIQWFLIYLNKIASFLKKKKQKQRQNPFLKCIKYFVDHASPIAGIERRINNYSNFKKSIQILMWY